MSISILEMKSFIDTTHAYAARDVGAIFDGVQADGVADKINEALETAFGIGLAASPDPGQPGYDYGIWGAASQDTGLFPPASMLSAVAEVCGGVAMNLHSQGLASSIVIRSGARPDPVPVRVAPAIQEEFGLPGWGTLGDPGLDAPARVLSEARQENEGYCISGFKPFVYSILGVEAMTVFCRVNERWGCFLVPLASEGVSTTPVGVRTGLRAAQLSHVSFNGVTVGAGARLDDGDALPLLRHALSLNWLGIAAIGSGIARGAVRAARKYAAERYQGGTILENLPAVRMLIAGAEANMEAAFALVRQASAFEPGAPGLMRSCAMARLAGLRLAADAITDSLQVLGGYGYMEDYGMEKRLRDIATLKCMAGTPQYLKQFIFESAEVLV